MRIVAALLLAAPAFASGKDSCPDTGLANLSTEEVQDLLVDWNLDQAMGEQFAAQKVDGFKLQVLSQPGAVNVDAYPNAQPFDWIALREHLATCAERAQPKPSVAVVDVSAAGDAEPRRLSGKSQSAKMGIQIKKDNGGIVLGKDGDVKIHRNGDSSLLLNATDVAVTNNLDVGGDLAVEGHLILNLGNISAANVDALAANIADLYSQIDTLQDQIDQNAECCETNTDTIDALLDAVSLLDATVNPYDRRVVYQSDFANSIDEWTFSGADLQSITCLNYTAIGGNLGSGDAIANYFDNMHAHSKLEVSFTFIALDSWDSEVASLELDGESIWSEAVKHNQDGNSGNVCGYQWADNFLLVEDIEVDHFNQGALMDFTASINSAYTDESWAVAEVTVTSKLSEEYTPVYLSDFDDAGAAGWTIFGGSDAETSTCGDHKIVGGYSLFASGSSLVKRVYDLPEHTQLVIAFEFVKIDTWDGEYAKLFVDDKLVWSQSMDSDTGNGANLCGRTNGDALVPITITVPHDEEMAKLRFTSTLDQGATDESWGIKSVSVYSHSPTEVVAYQSTFETTGDWVFSGATAAVTTCGAYNVLGGYGVLDYEDSVELYVKDLTPHTSMTIEFDFMKVDSWDSEPAYLYVDDVLEWSDTFVATDGTAMCGSSNSNWNEEAVPVSITFPHYAQGVKVKVAADLSSASSDESWGIANFKITTSMEECNQLVYASDFKTNLLDGWEIENAAIDNVTTCGTDVLIGGYNNFGKGATAQITVDLGSELNGVVVAFTFLKIDSWDSEDAILYADDVEVWRETLSAATGSSVCGRGNSNWHEDKMVREVDLGLVAGDSVTLRWETTLSSAGSDESWGLADLDVYTYQACDDVGYQSDFKNDGDDGWILVGSDGGTTTCDGDTLLGGYNIFANYDMAQRLVELPMHTSIQVDFTFVKIDSWDNEKAYFFLDHDTLWEQTLAGAGSQMCGQTNSGWNELYIEKTYTLDHFSGFAWLQWKSALSSGGTDESWGIENVKVTTFMDSAYTPVYQSRFHFEQLDGWSVANLDSSASGYFTSCGGITIFGGYKTFAKSASATKVLTHLPAHDTAVIAWTWAKLDSWDGEYFYVYADDTAIYSQQQYASAGDQLCGGSSSNWDESFYSGYEEVDHTSDELTLKFTTTINQAASDESWGLVSVSVYLK